MFLPKGPKPLWREKPLRQPAKMTSRGFYSACSCSISAYVALVLNLHGRKAKKQILEAGRLVEIQSEFITVQVGRKKLNLGMWLDL